MRNPGSCIRDENFKGQISMIDDEFKANINELIPFVANDDTDATSECPTLKIDPLKQVFTGEDFLEQINAIKEVFDEGLIEKPESMYKTFSKLSHAKAIKNAAAYWNQKVSTLLPYAGEQTRKADAH